MNQSNVPARPSEENGYNQPHAQLLYDSFQELTGRYLLNLRAMDGLGLGRALFFAPFALVSHNTNADPIFNYANQTALRLFQMEWDEFVTLPSRCSAEQPHRDERETLLKQVSEQGYIDNYSGIRISKQGSRFMISEAVVWNLVDNDLLLGQAAVFERWDPL